MDLDKLRGMLVHVALVIKQEPKKVTVPAIHLTDSVSFPDTQTTQLNPSSAFETWRIPNIPSHTIEALCESIAKSKLVYSGSKIKTEEEITAELGGPFTDSFLIQRLKEVIDDGYIKSLREARQCAEITVKDGKVLEYLGGGSNGNTWRIQHFGLGGIFAMKTCDKSMAEEVHTMIAFDSSELENVVRGFYASADIATIRGMPVSAIIMEYVDGQTLRQYLREQNSDTQEQRGVVLQILNGIRAMRKHGRVHRDLNLDNIMRTKKGGIKIVDFGSATDERNPLAKDAFRYGKPEGTEANDYFSLGLIAYRMLTGNHLALDLPDGESSTRYREIIAQQKSEILAPNGTVHPKYWKKIRKNVAFLRFRHDSKEVKNAPGINAPNVIYWQDFIRECLEGRDPQPERVPRRLWNYLGGIAATIGITIAGLYAMGSSWHAEPIKPVVGISTIKDSSKLPEILEQLDDLRDSGIESGKKSANETQRIKGLIQPKESIPAKPDKKTQDGLENVVEESENSALRNEARKQSLKTSVEYQAKFKPARERSSRVRIGCILPLTGPMAEYGLTLAEQLTQIQQEINNKGINGKQIELIFEDTRMDQNHAERAATSLISITGVKAIIGGFSTAETLAAAKVTEKEKVILISPSASGSDVTDAGDYVFRTCPSDKDLAEAMARTLIINGHKTAIILHSQNYLDAELRETFVQEYSRLGGKPTAIIYFPDDQGMSASIVAKKEASAIYLTEAHTSESKQLLRLLKEKTSSAHIYTGNLFVDTDQIRENKQLFEDMYILTTEFDTQNDIAKRLIGNRRKKYGAPISQFLNASARDALYLLAEAITEKGYDSKKIRDYLYQIRNWAGATGAISFDKNGDAQLRYVLWQVKDGKLLKQD